MTKLLCLLFACLVLSACGDDRPPAPTAEEAEQLDAAEELLNEQAEAENGGS